ncbi:MAG TPA: aspartyl/asparaginyl beta-hydroxylase domain-containing protein [Candidatus Acidoferrales bacterium]|nr:aspartyl/asparaginyl beta-hydroxylase domain-containing protein [Candidatus Acidoferrales bacterium]
MIKLLAKRVLLPIVVFAPLGYFFPRVTLFYALCGIYDVSRNRPITGTVLQRYFLGNGLLTWLLSPFNVLMDLLSLPYVNKGVYRMEELPAATQAEVKRVIDISIRNDLVSRMEALSRQFPRTMIFFRWYGRNLDAQLDFPEFHEPWKFLQTIGVSVFNKQVSTSKHFGFLRASIRVLYNLNDVTDRGAYIEVGSKTNAWCDNKLFIFDDTLMHQSFNETNQTRYCLFIDIIRPAPFPRVMAAIVRLVGFVARSFSYVFYKNWRVLEPRRSRRGLKSAA